MWSHYLTPGLGVGWRGPIREAHAQLTPAFIEVLAENHDPEDIDEYLRVFVDSPTPVITHGVSLSLGSATPPDAAILDHLNRVAEACDSPVISEHIALVRATALAGYDSPHTDVVEAGHLLPVPLNDDQLSVMIDNVHQVKAVLTWPLALEPIATLVEWPDPQMPEGEFVTTLLEATGTGLVLDIANVWANAVNHGRDPFSDIQALPLDRIAYCHIAGGTWGGDMYHDTHASPVVREVMALAAQVAATVGPLPLMLERDQDFPPEAELFAELDALADLARVERITSHPR